VCSLDSSGDTLIAYFEDYVASSSEDSAARTAKFYADNFIAAGPRGSAVFKNDVHFVSWLMQVREHNRRAGLLSMRVASIEQSISLSPRHLLATVGWSATFRKAPGQPINFRITYLLERSGDEWKMMAYISEKDQEEEMQKLQFL
jgi:hypothetical protein